MARTSTNSNSNKLSSRDLMVIAGAVLLIVIIYLLTSQVTYGIGFPLDNSWIHQTYARNLALHGEWAFRTGFPSAGSTSPLWSALLAIGFLLRLSPHIWTYFLGAVTLFALAVISEWAVRKIVASYRPRFPWVGIFIAFEWHLAWAAMSGMETLLHGLIVTTVLIMLMTNSPRYLTLWLAHWTGSLGAPRRFDSPRSRHPDDPDHPTRYTFTPYRAHSLSHWLWLSFCFLFIIQPCCRRYAHAEYVLCQSRLNMLHGKRSPSSRAWVKCLCNCWLVPALS